MKGKHGVVASENPICSEIGVNILRQEGSAVDAAIAASLCIGVTNFYASGIGGGGFMTVRNADGNARCIDFREEAPAASTTDMFSKNPSQAQIGGLSVGIPGELRGLFEAHQRYGKLPWKTLVKPSVALSRDGWIITKDFEDHVNPELIKDPAWAEILAPEGRMLRQGDVIKRTKYARTLQSIAEEGIDSFYNGSIARQLVKTIKEHGGIMTLKDLASYNAKVLEPLVGSYRGYTIITSPPPSSGAVLLAVLNILEGFSIKKLDSLTFHRIIESWKFGYAQRSFYGDPIDPIYRNITEIMDGYLKEHTARTIRRNISDSRTFNVSHYFVPYDVKEDQGTMHISVLTAAGEAVSLTSTVNLVFGSRVLDRETGILLNDQMDDFSIPGISNYFGLAPSPYNFIHPGKRPLSSSVPTIIEDDGQVKFVAGASGGSRIITATLQVIIEMIDLKMDPAIAIHEPRAHHQLLPNTLVLEQEFDHGVAQQLSERGHNITWLPPSVFKSGVEAILVANDGTILGASDARKGGHASAF